MVETIMYFAGGFLVASLLALALISAVHRRAVRLTRRRLEDAIPVSMAEIQAEKDNLRAAFAMSARRLEMTIEQLKARCTVQLGEIARKDEAIERLKVDLVEKTAMTDAVEAAAKSLSIRIEEHEQHYRARMAALEANERTFAAKDAGLAAAASKVNEDILTSDTLRVENAVLKTQIEQLKTQTEDLQTEAERATARLGDERRAVAALTREIAEKRQIIDMLRPQMDHLEREIAMQGNALEGRARRIGEIESVSRTQQEQLRERDEAIEALHLQMADGAAEHQVAIQGVEADKRATEALLAAANATIQSHVERIGDLENRIAELDRTLLQRGDEFEALQRQAAADQGANNKALERVEAEKATRETLLASAYLTIQSHTERIDELESQIAGQDGTLVQRASAIEALQRQIAEVTDSHTVTVDRHETEKHTLDSMLASANLAIQSHAERIGELESQIAGQDGTLAQRASAIEALQRQVATMEDAHVVAVDRFETEQRTLESMLASAKATIQVYAERISTFESQAAAQEQLLSQRVSEIDALHREMNAAGSEHEATAERLNAEKAALETVLAEAHRTVESHASRIDHLENLLAEQEQLTQESLVEVASSHDAHTASANEYAAAVAGLQSEKEQLRGVLQSAERMLEIRADRIEELESWITERNEWLRQRDEEIATIREESAAANARVLAVLQNTEEDRQSARQELLALRQAAEQGFGADRAEQAMLRDRMDEIAARIVQITMAGNHAEPIAAILADGARQDLFVHRSAEEPSGSGVAERIAQNGSRGRVP
jgi:chromosome segregation ATPase